MDENIFNDVIDTLEEFCCWLQKYISLASATAVEQRNDIQDMLEYSRHLIATIAKNMSSDTIS